MQRQGRKAILMIDNARGHLCELESIASTALIALPGPTLRFVQPLLAGIIRTFKSNYRRNLLEIYTEISHQEASQALAQKQNEQRLALQCAHSAWDQITPTTIRNCFNHTDIISARLDDGFTTALDQNPASNHSSQFASDLDMEKSLMATQSALIQLQRDLQLPESSQLSIEDFLELESYLDLQYPPCPVLTEDGQMLTDEELVQESKFLASQLLEETRCRKQEDNHESPGSGEGVPVLDPSPTSSNELTTTTNEPSKPSTKRAIKPRPKRKPSAKPGSSPTNAETVPPENANGTSAVDHQHPLAGPVQHSSSATMPVTPLVPLSVQEMVRLLDRLEFSLPFYLSPSPPHSLHPLHPPSSPVSSPYQSNSSTLTALQGAQNGFGILERQHLDSLLSIGLSHLQTHHQTQNLDHPQNLNQSQLQSQNQQNQHQNQQASHLNHQLTNLTEANSETNHQRSVNENNETEGGRGKGDRRTDSIGENSNNNDNRLFDLDSSILLDHLESTLNQSSFPVNSLAPLGPHSHLNLHPDLNPNPNLNQDRDQNPEQNLDQLFDQNEGHDQSDHQNENSSQNRNSNLSPRIDQNLNRNDHQNLHQNDNQNSNQSANMNPNSIPNSHEKSHSNSSNDELQSNKNHNEGVKSNPNEKQIPNSNSNSNLNPKNQAFDLELQLTFIRNLKAHLSGLLT
jgi:hypothetical protein